MKNYYVIHVPVHTEQEYVYISETQLLPGCRVRVSFNGKEMVGISGEKAEVSDGSIIKYKSIIEVMDDTPILSDELYKLGVWISRYYQCSVAKALFAMIPSIMIPEINSSLKWIHGDAEVDVRFAKLRKLLQTAEWLIIKDIRKNFKNEPLYRMIEEAEAYNYIEVKRNYKHKVKPQTKNYIEMLKFDVDPLSLPEKQREAYQLIQNTKLPMPMSDISSVVSYSVLKSLAKKELIRIFPKKVDTRMMFVPEYLTPKHISLSVEQSNVVTEILTDYAKHNRHLLYGITGSGKTEIYIEIMRKYVSDGKGVIFLIPEIALTPQMVERFFSIFGDNLAIMHSQLSERERYEQWKRILERKCRIVIGARSAIFVPLPDIGLIIVDEEHEQSYKQDQTPRYNGRDVAVVRAKMSGAQIILGSATPSLESWRNALSGNYRLHTIRNRPLSYALPEVELINMRDEEERDLISEYMREAILEVLSRKQQVILFQNRRGFSSFVQCLKCGELLKCNNCEISMYYHRDREELNCHYCGNAIPVPRRCPQCGGFSFGYGAAGTQKVEQLLNIYFPQAKVLRIDSDSASKKDMYKIMYERMKTREVDVLLGTQMISKGLDFPGVTLVGVISADISLNVPDFRAAERTFQLLTQVAGRSGRGVEPGKVMIQSYNTEHYAIQHACSQDYEGFAAEEMSYRKRLYYPPYYRLARIVYSGSKRVLLEPFIEKLRHISIKLQSIYPIPELFVLGPSEAPNAKVNSLYRYHMIIKAKDPEIMSTAIRFVKENTKLPHSISSFVDIDPMMLM